MKQKHSKGPDGEVRTPPTSGRGRGRPRKNVNFHFLLLGWYSPIKELILRVRNTSMPQSARGLAQTLWPTSNRSTTNCSRGTNNTNRTLTTQFSSIWSNLAANLKLKLLYKQPNLLNKKRLQTEANHRIIKSKRKKKKIKQKIMSVLRKSGREIMITLAILKEQTCLLMRFLHCICTEFHRK